VPDWPADCRDGELTDAYTQWRCDRITRLVEAVSHEAKQVRPGIDISAAVFRDYPGCRRTVAQDWVHWVEQGYLDFLCPMDYTESDIRFETEVADQLRRVGGRIPVYPGIGASASNSRLTPDRVAGQIHLAREAGAQGFTIFNFARGTAERLIPVLGHGPTGPPR
jgi:uncharacterized lipoprotein YddW (UPF0748 family)